MSSEVGIVCGRCDWFNPRNGESCSHCGYDLSFVSATESLLTDAFVKTVRPAPLEVSLTPAALDFAVIEEVEVVPREETVAPWIPPPLDEGTIREAEKHGVLLVRPVTIGSAREQKKPSGSEEHMEQARHYICKSCYSPVPGGHKFCGKCGAPSNFGEDYGSTQYFGAMQVPNKAKLILIKGEGLDGISYHLNSTEHVAGRQQGAILFPDDAWLSPRHANFFYRDNKLFVRDENSINGVYVQIRKPVVLEAGDMFLCGEQVFRVENADPLSDGPETDGTYFYASPTKNWSLRVVQILPGGVPGTVVHDEGGKVTIGREDCMMNFLNDVYMSPKHASVEVSGDGFLLTDLESQNGTYTRIEQERALAHGDYVFVGKQLLRVEVTP